MSPDRTIPDESAAGLADALGALDGASLPGRCETCGGSAEVRLVRRVPGLTLADLSIRHTPGCPTDREAAP